MAKGANTVRIGAFVLFGLILLVTAVAVFGGGRLFRESRPVIMHFTASMQGLNRGAPVMFSGVPIGEVTDILLRLDEVSLQPSSAVIANIFPDRFERINETGRNDDRMFAALIDKGLRARLVPVSIVTGQLGIELGFYPNTPVRISASKPDMIEIPTIPSTVERLETTVQSILNLIEKADLNALSKDVEQTMQSVTDLVTMPELKTSIVDASSTLRNLRSLSTALTTEVPQALASLRAASQGAEGLVGDTRRMLPELRGQLNNIGPMLAKLDTLLTTSASVLKTANSAIAPDSPVQTQLLSTMADLSRTSAAIRSLATALEDNPNSILFGAIQGANQ